MGHLEPVRQVCALNQNWMRCAARSEERCAKQEAFLKEQQASLDRRKELSESSLTGGAVELT